jgi:DNA-binding MarR family transcriptional regulator
MDILKKEKLIFSKIFSLSNKLHALGSKPLGNEITIRQWLITAAVAQFGEYAPTIGEVAIFVGSSHQNVKQLAIKLEKRGYMNIQKDEKDLRTSRLVLREEYYRFMETRQEQTERFLENLFKDFSKDDIEFMQECLNKLYEGVIKLEV